MSRDALHRSWRSEKLFALLLTGLFAVLLFGTLRQHEPWRDEAQTWLIGRDASLRETFELLRYQAHPALWYLMVRPLVRLDLPYSSMGLLHGLIAVANAFLVLRFAPLPRLTRALLVFSFWMFWMYAVESRVYAIGILLLFLIAWRYPERHARPWLHGALVALLFNSNLHMFFLAAALAAAFAWETLRGRRWDRGHVLSLGLMAAGALALAWQFDWFRPPADNMHGGAYAWNSNSAVILRGIATAIFPGAGDTYAYWIPPALALLLLCFYALLTRPAPLGILLVHVTGMSLLLWWTTAQLRHSGLFLLGAVFAMWISRDHGDSFVPRFLPEFGRRWTWAVVALNVGLILSLHEGWKMHVMDRSMEYSGTRRMAEYIRLEGLAAHPVAAHRYAHLSAIAAYFPGKKFWYIGIGEWATYVRQDRRHQRAHALSHDEALRILAEQDLAREPLLLLTDVPFAVLPPGFRALHKVDDRVWRADEVCYLYFREPTPRGEGP
ncbi:MAG: hypothetical protein KA248_10050 [Kiritimatiellae bacterium]|nr:hypothetical protein [Kiritimatiellia bacterium]